MVLRFSPLPQFFRKCGVKTRSAGQELCTLKAHLVFSYSKCTVKDFGCLVSDPETTTPVCSILCDQSVLFRESTACSTWRGAVEGVCLGKARLHYAQLASRGEWESSERSSKYKIKTKKAGLESCLLECQDYA